MTVAPAVQAHGTPAVQRSTMNAPGLSEDPAVRDGLLVIAEDIAQHAGFGAVVMSVRHSVDDLKVVAVAGDARVRDGLHASVVPLEALMGLLQNSQPWGDLHFVEDATAHPAAGNERWSWMDDAVGTQLTSNGSAMGWNELPWKRENALLAPMIRDDGEVLGLVSVDLPNNGRQPSERQRLILSVFAHQAERLVTAAALRAGEAHQLRLAHAARQVVREAGLQHQLTEILPRARAALLDNLGLQQAWIKSTPLASPPGAAMTDTTIAGPLMAPAAGDPLVLWASLLQPLSNAAQHCWDAQSVVELSAETTTVPGMQRAGVRKLLAFLAHHDVASALLVPLGSGEMRLGSMLLGRSEASRAWSDAEKGVCLDIGHDLGRAMVHTLWVEAQLLATEELRQYAEHKRQLMMSMSHELQTPLASIRAHVELIMPDITENPTTLRALGAIDRGADRLTKLINNMIWLARFDDPHRNVDMELVDLVGVVRDVVDDAIGSSTVVLADAEPGMPDNEARRLILCVPDSPVWVVGTRSELVLMCCNLVANAAKYTDAGGVVHIEVIAEGETVELIVRDDGIGVAAHETELIFDDFYRSSSPAARLRSGTGLGLSIVKRIAARHHGSILVNPGTPGTVFSVRLAPAGGSS